MKYLSFDIECCNGCNICEFGYVIFDEKFNILHQEDIVINPKKKFKLVGRKDGRDLYLCHTEDEYFKSPEFDYFYEKIKKIIDGEYESIIGFAMRNDSIFLKNATKRYKLEKIDFKFFDMQKFIKKYLELPYTPSLEKCLELLDISVEERLHRPDIDSQMTMQIVKTICSKEKWTIDDLIRHERFFTIKAKQNKIINNKDNKMTTGNRNILQLYLKNIKPQGRSINTNFDGKKICLDGRYEKLHCKEIFTLAQVLKNCGSDYTCSSSEANIYVAWQEAGEQVNEDERLRCVRSINEKAGNITIIEFREFLNLLNIDEDYLLNNFKLELWQLGYKEPRKKEPKHSNKNYVSGSSNSTFADFAKKQGIDLSKIQ